MTTFSMMSQWARAARETPDLPALTVGDDASISWIELQRRSNQLARRLARHGVVEGDFVSIALPNGVPAVLALLATLKLGAVPNPLSARLPGREFAELVELARPRILITDSPEREHLGVPWLPGDPDVAAEDDSDLPDVIAPSFKAPTSGGSTGRPKIILSGLPAVIDVPDENAPGYVDPTTQCWLFAGPIYHNMASAGVLNGLSQRFHVVIEERFDPELTLRVIERHRVTFSMMVPTMLNRMARLPEEVRDRYDLSSITILHSGAACPPALKRTWIDWIGPDRVVESYTATEQSAMSVVTGREWLERPGTVGRAVTGEFEIRDENGERVPPGRVGTIWMRRAEGAPRTFTYIGQHTEDRDDRWETVGDLGYMDDDGYLFIADRRADLIISGGANIYPAEIEAVLSTHPGVEDSVVIGLPDDDMGQRVHAIIQRDQHLAVTEGDLVAYVESQLARLKRPRSYEFVDQPLRNDAGKVRRTALRQERLSAPTDRVSEHAMSGSSADEVLS